MNLLKKLLGGRPMRREAFAFNDQCSGASVGYYIDSLGRRWMAENRWALFRVPAAHQATKEPSK
jgi:hypothetical protein